MTTFNLDVFDITLLMVVGLFVLGVITLLIGILLLITRSAGKEVWSLAAQTAQLAKKGTANTLKAAVSCKAKQPSTASPPRV